MPSARAGACAARRRQRFSAARVTIRAAGAIGRPNGNTLAGMTDLTFTHEREQSRYALRRGDDLLGVLDYADDGQTVAMTRAFTTPSFRGNGYAAVLVERAVAELEAAGDRRIRPVCWYVAEWFDAHPERAGILQERTAS